MKCLLLLFTAMALVFNVDAAHFSKAEQSELQMMVRNYLLAHPEILMQMSQALQQKQYQQMQKKALVAIKANKVKLLNPNETQVAGNPKGKVTLVELFDYQCLHCANLHRQGVIANLIKNNPELRIVYKEFPILGAASIYASRAAMAANKQGKYLVMRAGIFNIGAIEGELTAKGVDALAKKIGLNMQMYHNAISDRAFAASIEQSYQLAKALGIQGTPSFVIAPTPKLGNRNGKTTFIAGAVATVRLQRAINAAK